MTRNRHHAPPLGVPLTLAPKVEANRLREIHDLALRIAISELGKGEEGANNRGEFIRFLRTQDGTGRGPKGAGAWCAAYMSSILMRAAGQLGYVLPVKTTRSAQAIYKRVGREGRFVEVPVPGDLICWYRTKEAGDWRGHVGIVELVDGDAIRTVEGNRGPYPSRVSRYTYSLERERRRKLLGFSRLW